MVRFCFTWLWKKTRTWLSVLGAVVSFVLFVILILSFTADVRYMRQFGSVLIVLEVEQPKQIGINSPQRKKPAPVLRASVANVVMLYAAKGRCGISLGHKCILAHSPPAGVSLKKWGKWCSFSALSLAGNKNEYKQYSVRAPIVLFILAALASPAMFAIRSFRRRLVRSQRKDLGHCLTCGYDARGNASDYCPECGNRSCAESD